MNGSCAQKHNKYCEVAGGVFWRLTSCEWLYFVEIVGNMFQLQTYNLAWVKCGPLSKAGMLLPHKHAPSFPLWLFFLSICLWSSCCESGGVVALNAKQILFPHVNAARKTDGSSNHWKWKKPPSCCVSSCFWSECIVTDLSASVT